MLCCLSFSFGEALIQFALLDGDSIYDSFADLTRIDFALAQLYLYTFILMFICVVHNLFVSIIQKIYSDYRKEETRAIIDKEKEQIIEKEKLKEAESIQEEKKEEKEEDKEEEVKVNQKLILKIQFEGIMNQLEDLQKEYEAKTKDIPSSKKEELDKQFKDTINSLIKEAESIG